MGVAPNSDLPSIRSVTAASMSFMVGSAMASEMSFKAMSAFTSLATARRFLTWLATTRTGATTVLTLPARAEMRTLAATREHILDGILNNFVSFSINLQLTLLS